MKTRYPAVEGRFYPGSKKEIENLIAQIESSDHYPEFNKENITTIGAILPHAGHIYSGYQTVPFFKYLQAERITPETIVILNPNHSGLGAPIALDGHSFWNNSSGTLEIDKELGKLIPYPEDSTAHDHEHSCEVIIPFIQYYLSDSDIKILPISMSSRTAIESEELAISIHEAVKKLNRNVLVIASSDFSHFLTPEEGFQRDQHIIDQIAEKSCKGVERVTLKYNIPACGTGPIMTLMAYAGLVSSKYSTEILARGHSGEVSPSSEVVNYISMIFYY